MSKERAFLEYPRKEPGYRSKNERMRDFRAVELRLTDEEILQQAARCMNCGTPFCHAYGCPLNNVIPELTNLVYHQRWKEALDLLLATNPFPEFTSRVCPAVCEGSCVLGINAGAVTIRQLERAITEKGFDSGYIVPRPPKRRRTERVAVIGSGPAGLAAADRLNRAGFNVVVYENAARPGGILRYGIPEFKLEKRVIDRRIQLMTDEGIAFETNVNVGVDISLRFLQGHFNAIVLTGGARTPRDLQVPGRELAGIHQAMDYLVQQNKRLMGELVSGSEITAEGKNVAVIGGGDTGSDCLGTALRQGARLVRQFEILPKPPATRDPDTPWPLWPNMLRVSSSHEEGGERRWSVSAREFHGENGCVKAICVWDVEWFRGQGGKPSFREKTGTNMVLPAELVILALGFTGPGHNRIVEELGLRRDARSNILVDADHMTSVSGVFAAGDMVTGSSLVVRAVADGRAAAEGIMRRL